MHGRDPGDWKNDEESDECVKYSEMLLDICRYHVVGALVLECTVIYYTEGRIRVPGLMLYVLMR